MVIYHTDDDATTDYKMSMMCFVMIKVQRHKLRTFQEVNLAILSALPRIGVYLCMLHLVLE